MRDERRRLLNLAWAILAWHNKGADDSRQTLNRLFQEHLSRFYPNLLAGSPNISEDSLEPRVECWPPDRLDELRRGHTKHQPDITDLPILVVEYAANTYLIDGSSRVNLAVNDGRPHDVILLRVGDV